MSAAHLLGLMVMLFCFMADSSTAMPPQALGLLMLVPFMSCRPCWVLQAWHAVWFARSVTRTATQYCTNVGVTLALRHRGGSCCFS